MALYDENLQYVTVVKMVILYLEMCILSGMRYRTCPAEIVYIYPIMDITCEASTSCKPKFSCNRISLQITCKLMVIKKGMWNGQL